MSDFFYHSLKRLQGSDDESIGYWALDTMERFSRQFGLDYDEFIVSEVPEDCEIVDNALVVRPVEPDV